MAKVTAAQILPYQDGYAIFYIGFRDEHHAQIGAAFSPDGIDNWVRHPENPLIRPTKDGWDADACYKPYAVETSDGWLLWYNGRKGTLEQIGAAIHHGRDLGFISQQGAHR